MICIDMVRMKFCLTLKALVIASASIVSFGALAQELAFIQLHAFASVDDGEVRLIQIADIHSKSVEVRERIENVVITKIGDTRAGAALIDKVSAEAAVVHALNDPTVKLYWGGAGRTEIRRKLVKLDVVPEIDRAAVGLIRRFGLQGADCLLLKSYPSGIVLPGRNWKVSALLNKVQRHNDEIMLPIRIDGPNKVVMEYTAEFEVQSSVN